MLLQAVWPPIFVSALCWAAVYQGFLLFHTAAEMFSIAVAVAAMMVASTSRKFVTQHFVVFVSIAIGWCAGLDLIHTLAFKGMHLLPGESANPATQLWVAARMLQALALLVSPLLLQRKLPPGSIHLGFGVIFLLVIASIVTGLFPTAYIDGQGLTTFKIYTEYVIIAILGTALFLFWRYRALMSTPVFYGMAAAILFMMASEFAFTQYVSVYAQSNLVGHVLKIFAYWFVFVALVQSTVREPFLRLQEEVQAREKLAEERAVLSNQLGERVKELRCLQELSEYTKNPTYSPAELLEKIVHLLPSAFVFPDRVRIGVEGEWGQWGAVSPRAVSKHMLVTPVFLGHREVATIRTWYPPTSEQPDVQFLPEEMAMLQQVGQHVGDALERLDAAESLQRLQYFYEMLSATNRAVVRSRSREELLDSLFNALLLHGAFPKLFMAMTSDGSWPLRLWRQHGVTEEKLPLLQHVLSDSDSPLRAVMDRLSSGQLAWDSMAQKDAAVPQRPPGGSPIVAWIQVLQDEGITQRAVMPLICQGRLLGVVSLYAAGLTRFDEQQLRLLQEMAGDMEYALDQLSARQLLQETEQKVSFSEFRFSEVFQASPVPMQIMSLTGHRTRAINKAHTRWLGYQLEEIADEDKWFELVFRDKEKREALRTHWQASVAAVRDGEQSSQSPELTLYCKDGGARIAQGTVTVVGDDLIIAWTDLTDIRQQEQVLRESEKRFRNMVEQTISGIFVRRDGRYIYVNPRFCEIVGWSQDELLGQDVLKFTNSDPGNIERIRTIWAELESNPSASINYSMPFLRKDGQLIEVGLTAKVITWDDGLPATIVMAQDITERKRAQDQIAAYVKQLESSMRGTLQAVANMVEIRDPYTAGHERRVGMIARAIASEMGWTEERCSNLELIGWVHDVGKISVPSEILTKPTKLSKLDWEFIRGHAQAGFDILKDIPFPMPVADVILQHHERMDGSGYPQGLKGDEILPEARVLAVADVIESMASHRPYRPAVGLDSALAEIVKNRGTLYAPEVVDAVVRLVNEKGYVLPV